MAQWATSLKIPESIVPLCTAAVSPSSSNLDPTQLSYHLICTPFNQRRKLRFRNGDQTGFPQQTAAAILAAPSFLAADVVKYILSLQDANCYHGSTCFLEVTHSQALLCDYHSSSAATIAVLKIQKHLTLNKTNIYFSPG